MHAVSGARKDIGSTGAKPTAQGFSQGGTIAGPRSHLCHQPQCHDERQCCKEWHPDAVRPARLWPAFYPSPTHARCAPSLRSPCSSSQRRSRRHIGTAADRDRCTPWLRPLTQSLKAFSLCHFSDGDVLHVETTLYFARHRYYSQGRPCRQRRAQAPHNASVSAWLY